MSQRLDTQRSPGLGRTHKRLSSRYQTRGHDFNPHTPWGDSQRVSAQKSAAAPADAFIAETTVTASDSTNAARLAPLGFVANPTTNWTTGQGITVGGFAFNWNGSAWAAGNHA